MLKKEKPHFVGHRERLRTRFREKGMDGVAEYELVEMILARATPRGDVKPLAKKLLKHFGGFAHLINASRSDLISQPNVGDRIADELFLFHEAIKLALKQKLLNLPLLIAWQDLFDYCQQTIGYKSIECLHAFFLNAKHYLIKDQIIHEGSVSRMSVFPRDILRHAINCNASSVVLAHNHPSGNPEPSHEDIALTKEIADVLKAADIKLHDHVLVAKGAVSSFQQLNLFRELNP
jgi:DNA repair protein RadC